MNKKQGIAGDSKRKERTQQLREIKTTIEQLTGQREVLAIKGNTMAGQHPAREGWMGPRASLALKGQHALWLPETVLVKGFHLELITSYLAFLRAT